MSQTPEAPDELPETFEAKVIAQLTVYSIQKDAKGKIKDSKAPKTKELVFAFSENNYIEFLQVLLAKHSHRRNTKLLRDDHTLSNIFIHHPKCVLFIYFHSNRHESVTWPTKLHRYF